MTRLMLSMLVTRPEPDASETVARLAALDIGAIKAPLLNFKPLLTTTLPAPGGFAAIAATSANALRALRDRGEIPHFRHLPVFAVGERTAATARDLGFHEVVSAAGNMAALVELLAKVGLDGPIFYPAARNHSGDLVRALAPHGIMVIMAPVYAMVAAEKMDDAVLAALEGDGLAAALFYSQRTAQAFVSIVDSRISLAARRNLGMLCLSEDVAAPLVDAHFVRIGLADHPSEEAMMSLALSFARDQNPA